MAIRPGCADPVANRGLATGPPVPRPDQGVGDGARQIAEGRFTERIPVRQNDELGELASDFNAMAEMLARTEEFRRQWVSDSSHELRTPIAVLRAEIEALQDGCAPATKRPLTACSSM
ncbi:MAG: HAMP domain-containing protein [Synechococcaceae cyanobacterium SM1_2_3]|nr:HAMP domain-containing protein [Synechococcaceae cyanobacterium SM1_2_3]